MNDQAWYQSTTIQGGLVQLFVFLDLMFKFNIGNETVTALITGVFGLIGTIMVIYGRLKAKKTVTVAGISFNK